MHTSPTTSETPTKISYAYALKTILGWSILYFGSLVILMKLLSQDLS